MRSIRTLGICLGTKKLGVAVVEPYFVFDCALKTFDGAWSPEKLSAILAVIEKYVKRYQVNHLAVKVPPTYTHSRAITELIREIKIVMLRGQIDVSVHTMEQVKEAWGINEILSKKEMIERVLTKYHLQTLFEKKVKDRSAQYEKIVEAVASS